MHDRLLTRHERERERERERIQGACLLTAVLCRQWSVPVPLPLPLLGIFAEGTIQDDSTPTPFSEDLEHKVLNHSLGTLPPLLSLLTTQAHYTS